MAQDHVVKTFKTEEIQNMGALTAYREANPVKTGSFRPNIDQKANPTYNQPAGPGKDFLVRTGVPFTLTDGYQSDHGEWAYVDYIITFEDSEQYRALATATGLEREYVLSLPETEDRMRQLAILREQYINVPNALKLIQVGKRFDLTEA